MAVELLRRGKEVDFFVKEGLSINPLLQVCYEVDDPQTRKREISGLIKPRKRRGVKNWRF